MFPAQLDTRDSLLQALNNWGSELARNVTSTDTTLPLRSVTGLPASGLVSVNDEVVHYDSLGTASGFPALLGCTRGADGTRAQAYRAGEIIELRPTAAHHNRLADAVAAIEANIGVGAQGNETSVAARLEQAQPLTISKSGTVWTHTHDRGRICAVQAWVLSGVEYVLSTSPITQTAAGVITVTHSLDSTGFIIVI